VAKPRCDNDPRFGWIIFLDTRLRCDFWPQIYFLKKQRFEMDKKLRAIVVTTGSSGPLHAGALKRSGIDVAGVVGSTRKKSRSAEEHPGVDGKNPTFGDLRAVENTSRPWLDVDEGTDK
jgi:hypothetical protein